MSRSFAGGVAATVAACSLRGRSRRTIHLQALICMFGFFRVMNVNRGAATSTTWTCGRCAWTCPVSSYFSCRVTVVDCRLAVSCMGLCRFVPDFSCLVCVEAFCRLRAGWLCVRETVVRPSRLPIAAVSLARVSLAATVLSNCACVANTETAAAVFSV